MSPSSLAGELDAARADDDDGGFHRTASVRDSPPLLVGVDHQCRADECQHDADRTYGVGRVW